MSNEKTAHTPGPWIADDGDVDLYGVFQEADGQAICYLGVPSGGPFRRLRPKKAAANAALLAAAPELLAACEEALAEARERDEDLGYGCWPQVLAAIAKARGEVTE